MNFDLKNGGWAKIISIIFAFARIIVMPWKYKIEIIKCIKSQCSKYVETKIINSCNYVKGEKHHPCIIMSISVKVLLFCMMDNYIKKIWQKSINYLGMEWVIDE